MTGRENLGFVARLFGLDGRGRAAADRARQLASPRPPTAWSARTRAVCGDGSISAPASSARPAAAPRRADHRTSTRGAASSCGTRSQPGGRWHRRAAHHPVPGGGRPARPPRRDHRPRPRHRRGTPDELKDRAGRDVIEVRPRAGRGPPGARTSSGRSPPSPPVPTPTPSRLRRARTAAPNSSPWSSACSTSTASWSTTSVCAGPRSTRCSSPSPDGAPRPTRPISTTRQRRSLTNLEPP